MLEGHRGPVRVLELWPLNVVWQGAPLQLIAFERLLKEYQQWQNQVTVVRSGSSWLRLW